LRYCIGQKAVPLFGKIFVFKGLNEAKIFCINNRSHKIVFRCVGKGVKRIYKATMDSSDDNRFWELKRRKKSDPNIFLPLGSEFKCYVSDYVIPVAIEFDNEIKN
jgi:hypothetical protein